MTSNTAHHTPYMPGYNAVRHHEWRTAENSAAFLLPELRTQASRNPSLRLLDCGAGSGTISTSLATYMPTGTVVATDLSDDIIAKAAAYATSKDCTNISFQKADIYALPFPNDSFDVVHAHQVLCHLDSPVQAMREMLRVCKTGGVVASRESDLRMCNFHPETEGMRLAHRAMLETIKVNGGWADGGARLLSWTLQAGAVRERVKASMGTWCYSTPEERAMWSGSMLERIEGAQRGEGGMYERTLESGVLTTAQLGEMAKAWREWAAAEDGMFGCMHGEVLIWK
ncbi:hypothetical protein MBLNU230_g5574t1 [Neophaeotheca triangularis]